MIALPFDNGATPLVVPDIVVSEPVKINSIVEGNVEWGTPPGNASVDGEVILEGASFVDRRIVSNISPAAFRFDNVPPGSYVLKSNPLRNGYEGVSASFMVSEGIDLTGLSLATILIAPVITSVSPAGTITGSNFGIVMANIEVTVDGRPVAFSSLTDTSCAIDLSNLAPGDHVVQMHKTIPAGRVDGNKIPFTRTVQSPTGIVAASTDTSITFTWQNAPHISEVEIILKKTSDSTVVRPLQRIVGNSFTYSNLQASTTYRIEVTSTYPGMPPSDPPTTLNASTKQFSAAKPALMTLAGSNSYTTNGQVFGFEMMNDKTYIAYAETGIVYVRAYDSNGVATGTAFSQSISTSQISEFDFCAGNGSLYLLYPSSTIPTIQTLNADLTPATGSIQCNGVMLPVASKAKIEFFGGNLFVSSEYVMSGVNLNVTMLDSIISSSTPVYTGTNTQLTGSGYWVQTVADELSNDLYIAIATGPSMLASEILRKPLNDVTAAATLLTTIPSGDLISEFKLNGQELIITRGSSNIYFSVQRTSGETRLLNIPTGYLSSFGTDHTGRLWAFHLPTTDTSEKYIINIGNGQIVNSIRIADFANVDGNSIANPREFIKRQIVGTTMPNKFGMLHKKLDDNLGVFYYDGSM
jgi:hypothetical protein